MSEEHVSKKEQKILKKQEQAEAHKRADEEARAKTVRTWTIVVISAVVIVAFLGWLVQNAPEKGDLFDETPKQINVVDENDNKKGASDENAKLVLVEYSDFQCPACGAYYPFLKQLVETYGSQLQFVYRHLPIRHIHPNAELAARYAEAAGLQGKFFEMHDEIFNNQATWSPTGERGARKMFEDMAEGLGLDIEKLLVDVASEEVIAKVEANRIDAIGAGANSTPTFYVDGEQIANPRSFEEFEVFVQNKLGITSAVETKTPTLQGEGATPVVPGVKIDEAEMEEVRDEAPSETEVEPAS